MPDDQVAGRHDPEPPDGESPVGASADADESIDDGWGAAPIDDSAANLFSVELENVSASDWDVDTDLIWGDDEVDVADGEPGGTDLHILF